jgi:glycosyltransferase involved in cell wall biosynthesis
MPVRENTLDVIVPAYKERFLSALLESLAEQTCREFSVIVSDDCSSESLATVCESYAHRLAMRYVRFSRNLGTVDLAGHWNRSVALSNAKWILLPGDDDELERNCIEAFWRKSAESNESVEVYSFGVRVIDERDRVIRETRPLRADTAAQFLLQRYTGKVSPMPVGYVFSRDTFLRCGGFVSFDRGWHSDVASWALFGAETGVTPIDDAFVRWRHSSINISPVMEKDGVRSTRASLAFVSWMLCNKTLLKMSDGDVKNVVGAMNYWEWYVGLSEETFWRWLATAWRASSVLTRCATGSQFRHLYRFARSRWVWRA